MKPPQQYSRINLAELKAQIVTKLGPERSKQYFYYLNRLLSLKLTKVEFNKLCLRIVGRENIPLHNQFIRSIIKNACSAKVPPRSMHDAEVFKSTQAVENNEPSSDGHKQNGSHPAVSHASNPTDFSNGDILPRKARTGIRDRRFGDRRSSLGPNGKTSFASQQLSTTNSNGCIVILENGDVTAPDIQSPVLHHQGLIRQAENEGDVSGYEPAKLSVIKRSSYGPIYVHNKDQTELVIREDGKESARSLLSAPLGVPVCPISIGAARRALPLASSSKRISSFDNSCLLDTTALRERMEQIAVTQGLEGGVPIDSANLLNNGLDTFLKSLIRSCIELVGARSGHGPVKNSIHKQQAHLKLVNGVIPNHHYQMRSSSRPLEVMQEHRPHCPISLLDFRVAMELNPQQLGEDWPLLLEKICIRGFEE